MRTNIPLLVLFIVSILQKPAAQQTPFGTFYRNNMQLANPAAIDRILSYKPDHPTRYLTSNGRLQWLGIEGAPQTGFVQFENAPDIDHKYKKFPVRWGAQLLFDKTDILTNYGFYGNYSYEITYHKRIIRIGISPGLVCRQYAVADIRARDGVEQDPTLMEIARDAKRLRFDTGLGLFFYHRKEYSIPYWGFSLPNMFSRPFTPKLEQEKISDLARNFYFVIGRYMSAWNEEIERPRIDLEPTLWIRGVRRGSFSSISPKLPIPLSVDFNFRVYVNSSFEYPSAFWLGAGYGTNKQLSAEFGFNWYNKYGLGFEKNLQLSFAYNAPTSRVFLNQLGHSFEVNIAWAWD